MTDSRADPAGSGPAVSVVLPAYNAEAFLAGALDRLLAQTVLTRPDSVPGPLLEVVVVDDGSTDATAAVARGYADRHPGVVRVVEQPANAGVSAAREAGFRRARGAYIWFVDADDEWPDDAAERLLEAARGTGADVVCAAARYLEPSGASRPVGRVVAADLVDPTTAYRAFLRGEITGHLWNKLFSRAVLERVAFTPARQHSDQAITAQAVAAAGRVALLPVEVYRYRLRGGSILRSGAPRSESLRMVGQVVHDCAERVSAGLTSGPDYAYYRARFELLSRLKDATSGAYAPAEGHALFRAARAEVTPRLLGALVGRREPRRAVLLALAWASPRAYRAMMRLPRARA